VQTDLELTIDCLNRVATIDGLVLPCRIGRKGCIADAKGREGDEKTPQGHYHLRWGFYRADRLPKPPSHSLRPLTWRALDNNDAWCDAPQSAAYNRFIKLPNHESHEALWREDGAYDIILVINHNDSPPVSGRGSAVFIHIAQPDDRQTLGCIAFAPEDMVQLLPYLQSGLPVKIHR
jgi:L,D-peptidoglycan transpeptidase YkuD (ErfK/YbiS/YcfS/YnhG family)